MTYEEAITAAREGKPIKMSYIDGAARIESIYRRITRVGVSFVERNGVVTPIEYVELLDASGSVVNASLEACEISDVASLEAQIAQNEANRGRIYLGKGRWAV